MSAVISNRRGGISPALRAWPRSGERSTQAASGFSLVEVLIAILVLGIALTGLTQALSTALKSHKDSELQTTAALFAAGQIEILRAEGNIQDETTEGECGEGLSLYRWRQAISPAPLRIFR